MDEGLAYWKEQLEGIPERLELPTDRLRPAVQTFEAEVCHVTLPPGQVAELKRVSRENQATLYMTLLAALGYCWRVTAGRMTSWWDRRSPTVRKNNWRK